MAAQQDVRDMFDGGEICRGMVGSNPAFVVSEEAIHQPA